MILNSPHVFSLMKMFQGRALNGILEQVDLKGRTANGGGLGCHQQDYEDEGLTKCRYLKTTEQIYQWTIYMEKIMALG